MATAADVLAGRERFACDAGDTLAWLRGLPGASVSCCVTSPPYWGLRSYLPADHPDKPHEIGRERTPAEYVGKLVEVFGEVSRVLHPTGTLWLNLGDTYAKSNRNATRRRKDAKGVQRPVEQKRCENCGREFEGGIGRRFCSSASGGTDNSPCIDRPNGLKSGDAVGVPWLVAFALREAGWWLRCDVIWDKPNGMPESVRCRPGKAHEYVFMLSKGRRVFYDVVAVRSPAKTAWLTRVRGRAGSTNYHNAASGMPVHTSLDKPTAAEANLRSVWRIPVARSKDAHFAVMPAELARRCVLAGTSARGVCPACGEPWRRLVERKRVPTRPGTNSKIGQTDSDHTANAHGQRLAVGSPHQSHNGMIFGNRDPQRHTTRVETVGWEAGCKCDAGEPRPAVVIDPFGGSGTTVAVAVELGRRGISCDLNPEYAELARKRVAAVTPTLFTGDAG